MKTWLVIPIILSKSGSKKLIESCQTTKKTRGEKGNIWQAVITWLKQIQWKRLPTDSTQTKGANIKYLREKVEHEPRHGHVGGPRAGVARGAPAGAQLPSEENCVNNLLQSKLFLDTSISPVLASSGCYLGAAGQSSVGLVAVAAMLGKPSAGESPLLCWMYNCPTTPLLLLHRSSLQFCPVALLLPAPSSSILGGRK